MNCVSDILWKKPWLRISKPEERDIRHSPGKFDIVKDPFALNHMADGDNYRRLCPKMICLAKCGAPLLLKVEVIRSNTIGDTVDRLMKTIA